MCNLTEDIASCCELGVPLQFYKFIPLELKLTGLKLVQLSDFLLYFHGQRLSYQGGTAYSLQGSYPANEDPTKAIDGDPLTKWHDFDMSAITFRLKEAAPIDGFAFVTAFDVEDRDPIRFRFEGSNDGLTFILLQDTGPQPVVVPSARTSETEQFPINVPCLAPLGIANANSTSCDEGMLIASGSTCTPQCSGTFVPTLTSLTCTSGVLSPAEFACAQQNQPQQQPQQSQQLVKLYM